LLLECRFFASAWAVAGALRVNYGGNMKLIANWKSWPKMISMQAFLGIAFVQSVQVVTPAESLAAHIPFADGLTWGDLFIAATIALTVVGGLGRLIDQSLNAQ
jgi:hypothetical protein